MSNILRSDLPWQAAYISANVSRFYKILVKHNIVLDFAFYKLSLMYKITHNLIAIPISDFLISLVRPSWHYHPLSYRLITSTTDYYNFSFFPRVVVHWNNPTPPRNCGMLHLGTAQPGTYSIYVPGSTKQSARLTTSHHRKSSYFYF